MPDTPKRPERAVEELLNRSGVHAPLVHQIQQHARIDLAAPCSHDQSVERRKPHRARDAAPGVHRTHARAVAQMAHDSSPGGGMAVVLWQNRGDVLVREAVEPVAAYTRVMQFARNGEASGNIRIRGVECCIEARDLRHIWLPLQQRPDRRQVVRLVQWRQRDELLQRVQHIAVYRYGPQIIRSRRARPGVRRPRVRTLSRIAAGTLRDARRPRRGRQPDHRPRLFGDRTLRCASDEMRRRVDGFDLAADLRLQPHRRVRQNSTNLMLDEPALRTRIAFRVTRRPFPAARASSATMSTATAHDARRAISESARLVRMIGTRAPTTMPAASAPARYERLLASMLPASRSGTTRMSARTGHRRLDAS